MGKASIIVYCVPGTELIMRPSGALSLQPSDVGTSMLISQRNSERVINLFDATQLASGSTEI